jgi:hypothetical protein
MSKEERELNRRLRILKHARDSGKAGLIRKGSRLFSAESLLGNAGRINCLKKL